MYMGIEVQMSNTANTGSHCNKNNSPDQGSKAQFFTIKTPVILCRPAARDALVECGPSSV